MITIDQAAKDPILLGAALGDPKTWGIWLAVLRAAFGLKLNRKDRRAFGAVARRKQPTRRVRELWAVVGRRSGKSRMAGLLAVFFACLVPHALAAGEVGTVLVLAASKSQASVVFDYALGFLQASPVLQQEIESTTADEIRLRSGIVIAIHTASYRTVRGRTILAAIFDEVSFWRDDTSANPDLEVYRAVLPALASSGGMLIGISTPYRKAGLLHQKHHDYFGVDDSDVLVVAGSSEQFNSTLNKAVIANARVSDPESAMAEWDGEFRSDIAAFLDDATIDAAVDRARPLELPPRPNLSYTAFADPSGGRHDSYVLCIGHIEGGRYIADVIRGRLAPFDPQSVTAEFAALAKSYRCHEIVSDKYSAGWAEAEWKKHGLSLKNSKAPASDLYIESLPLFMREVVSIPDQPRLLRELRLLERRTGRSGKDTVSHGRSGTDDFANALCGMFSELADPRVKGGCGSIWMGYASPDMPSNPPGFFYVLAGSAPRKLISPEYEDPDSPSALARREAWQAEAKSRREEAIAILMGRS